MALCRRSLLEKFQELLVLCRRVTRKLGRAWLSLLDRMNRLKKKLACHALANTHANGADRSFN